MNGILPICTTHPGVGSTAKLTKEFTSLAFSQTVRLQRKEDRLLLMPTLTTESPM
jgi:precorrin-4 methylase